METLLLPFSPRFIVLTICAVVTALLIGIGIFDHNPKIVGNRADPDRDLRRAHAARHSRSPAKEPRGSAQLSDLGAYPFPARGNPPGDAAVFLREREGRHAVLPRHPRAGLSARQDASSTSGRSAPRKTSIARATNGCTIRWRRRPHAERGIPHHHRRPGLHQAVFGIGLQHLGDEFWRAQPQRRARAERRRQEGRLRA